MKKTQESIAKWCELLRNGISSCEYGVCVCACALSCGGPRSMLGVCFYHFPPSFLGGSLPELGAH